MIERTTLALHTGRRPVGLMTMLAVATLAIGCMAPQPRVEPGVDTRWSGRFTAGWTDASIPSGGDRATGRFELAAGAAQTTLEVRSPLGQTLLRAQAAPQGAWLETGDGRRQHAETPEALTEQVLGWRIPILRLPAWLAEDRPDQAVEGDWEVRIESRDPSRPRRLSLRWPADGGTVEGRSVAIRLIVDEVEPAAVSRP